nr:MAG TPA: hypothetical protein [Caudoviricetes sp.]
MHKNLSPAIDAPARSCYSKYDAAFPPTHRLHLPLCKSCRRRVLHPLHSRREASFCFARKRPLRRFFFNRQTTLLLK